MAAGTIGNPGSFLAEVAERRVQHGSVFLLLVPAGQRRIKADFPRWLADSSEVGAPRIDQEIFLVDDCDPLPTSSRDIVQNFAGFLIGKDLGLDLDGLIKFCAGYCRADTVSLLPGIAAAVMLAAMKSDAGLGLQSGDRDRRRILSTLLRNLGYRALRSFHLEFLIRCWKDRLDPDHGSNEESAGVVSRVDALLLAIRKNASIEVCSNSVDRLFDHIALNCGTEYDTVLANALAVGLGRPADLKMLWQSCENIAETVSAVRLLMLVERAANRECETAVEALRKVGERMLANKIDIPLGAALT
jgi:hypothetical protein